MSTDPIKFTCKYNLFRNLQCQHDSSLQSKIYEVTITFVTVQHGKETLKDANWILNPAILAISINTSGDNTMS
jgi:hypothetical protein